MKDICHRFALPALLALAALICGCRTASPDYHVLKTDRTYTRVIKNPYEWTLQQLADGPISGTNVSEWAQITLQYGLSEAVSDLNRDGNMALFLMANCPARVWETLVFRPVRGGYRYLGHFPASYIVLHDTPGSCLVYEACGGKYGYVILYSHDGKKFVGTMLDDFWWGDGHEEGNEKMESYFPPDKCLKWSKVLDYTRPPAHRRSTELNGSKEAAMIVREK